MAEEAYLGVSKPLSNDPPGKRDTDLNDALLVELKAQKNFESTEEGKKRCVMRCTQGNCPTDTRQGGCA